MSKWPEPGARAHATEFESYFGSIAGLVPLPFGKEEVLEKTLAQIHSIKSMIRWSIWTACWLIVYGKCGQLDHIFICLGRQSLIRYRLAPFELKVFGFFSQRLKGTHKKGCSNHFFCENQSGMGFGLVCIVASCFKQYTLKTQLGHQKSPELKLFQMFFFRGVQTHFFFRLHPFLLNHCNTSKSSKLQSTSQTFSFPRRSDLWLCVYLLKLCVDLFSLPSPRQRELPLFYF